MIHESWKSRCRWATNCRLVSSFIFIFYSNLISYFLPCFLPLIRIVIELIVFRCFTLLCVLCMIWLYMIEWRTFNFVFDLLIDNFFKVVQFISLLFTLFRINKLVLIIWQSCKISLNWYFVLNRLNQSLHRQ
jgi:hypothetical protein